MALSRAQWRDLLQQIKKGGIEQLRIYSESVATNAYRQGYEIGHNNAVEGVQGNLLDLIDDVLRKEYGFGPKRLAKFHEQLSDRIAGITNDIEEQSKQINENEQLTIDGVA